VNARPLGEDGPRKLSTRTDTLNDPRQAASSDKNVTIDETQPVRVASAYKRSANRS
jgi:hypothetical protein